MKVLKEIFKEKLQNAAVFLKNSSSSTIPGILLESSNRGIEIYATDLSSFYHSFIPTKKDKDFSIVVEPKKLIEVLNTLTLEEIEVSVEENKLVLRANRTKAEFPGMTAKEYPKPNKDIKNLSSFSNEILDNLPLVLFSAATDESRPILTGVNFSKKEEGLFLVATDGFRLSLVKTSEEGIFPLGDYVVPADFLKAILKQAKAEDQVKFAYDEKEKLVVFSVGEDEFFSRLIDGEFPPYEKVIPDNFSTEVVLEKDEFLRNVKFASVFAKDYSNVVLFDVKKEGIYLYPKTEEETQGSQAFQEPVELKGDEVKVAFNFRFLIEFLNHVPGDQVRIKIVKSEAPVVFELVGRDDFLHIIMPVRISQ